MSTTACDDQLIAHQDDQASAEHTPGPYSYDPLTQTIYGTSIGGCNMRMNMHKVADIRGWGHLQYLPNGHAIQDANGRLLAKAPEMKDFIKRLLNDSMLELGWREEAEKLVADSAG